MFRGPLYRLTVYLPLRFRDFCINSLAFFVRNERILEAAHKSLRGKSLIGVLPDGNLLIYPLDDFKLLPIVSEIYRKRIYDVEAVETCKCICDVGAHIGLFTLRVAKQAPSSKIIAIEANATNFKFLLKNVAVNGLKERVHGLNVAAGQEKGRVILWLSKLSRGDSSTKMWHDAGSLGHQTVDALPLDEILSNENFCDLLKIDVEGAEIDVLRGLKKQYARINRMVIETHISVVNVNKVYAWLHDHGFVLTETQRLYEDCVLLKARRLCM
jgi:FkbM family methyltransferase